MLDRGKESQAELVFDVQCTDLADARPWQRGQFVPEGKDHPGRGEVQPGVGRFVPQRRTATCQEERGRNTADQQPQRQLWVVADEGQHEGGNREAGKPEPEDNSDDRHPGRDPGDR